MKPAAKAVASESPGSKPLPPGASLIGLEKPNFQVIAREDRPELVAMVVNPDPGVSSALLTVLTSERETAAPTAELPAGFSAVNETAVNQSGYPALIRSEADGAVMALIPGGLGIQGDDGSPTAAPRHPIDVDAFYIDVYEVTVEKYLRFRESAKSERTPPSMPLNASFPQQPAVGVNWRDAMQYAKWARKELPTESEWEKAARGMKGFAYSWGDGRPIWGRRREPGQIDDVGSFRTDKSVFGVFDLAGNAREWCHDFFAEDAYKQAPAAGSAASKNWKGPRTDKAGRRVVKGSPTGWEVWAREGLPMAERSPQIGFRCVLRLPNQAANASSATASAVPAPLAAPEMPPVAPKKSAF